MIGSVELPRRAVIALLLGLAVGLLILVGCGGAGDDPDTAAAASTLGLAADVTADETDPSTAGGEPDGSDTTATSGDDADAEAAPDADADAEAPDEQPLPTTAIELIAAIDEAELALRQPGLDQATAAPWGRRQQALYRVWGFNPGWADDVLAGVDPSIAGAVTRNWTARQELEILVRSHSVSDSLPAWTIEPPAPADELLGYYQEAEAATGVPWSILASINLIETRMGRIRGISTAGAVGPMQFLPTTWAECCDGDPTDPRDAINGAGRYLVQRGGDDDLDRAIFGYNNSDHYVAAVTSIAAVLDAEPQLYYGYHAWEVYFLTTEGVIVLAEGYRQAGVGVRARLAGRQSGEPIPGPVAERPTVVHGSRGSQRRCWHRPAERFEMAR